MNLRRFSGEAMLYVMAATFEPTAGLLLLPLLGRFLTPSELGVADIITATGGIAFFAVGLNLDQALTRYYYDSDRRVLATTHATLVLANGAALVVGGIAALALANLTQWKAWTCALFAAPLTVLLEHVFTLFRLRHEPGHLLTAATLRAFAWVVVTAGLLVGWRAGVVAVFAGRLVGCLAATAAMVFWLRGVYARRGRGSYLRRSLQFAAPTIPATFASLGIMQAPRYFLGIGASAAEVGYYGVGVRLGLIIAMIGIGAAMAWGPFAMSVKDEKGAPEVFGRALLYLLAVNVAVVAPLCAFAREETAILMGARYLPAVPLIGPLVVASAFSNMALLLFSQIAIAERTHWQSVSYLLGLAVMSLLNLLLIGRWQSLGAAVATLVAQVVTAGTMYYAAQRHFPVPVARGRLAALCALLVAVLVTGAWLNAAFLPARMTLPLKGVLTFATWGACLALLGRREIRAIIGLARAIAHAEPASPERASVRSEVTP